MKSKPGTPLRSTKIFASAPKPDLTLRPTTDPAAIGALAMRLRSEYENVHTKLIHDLRWLEHNLKRARDSIESNGAVDPHLIINAASITETIARWNLARDLMPFLYPTPEGDKP